MQVRPLSKELQEIAIKELNEDPNRIEDDVKHIREWFSKQPHLCKLKFDDQLLVTGLRSCKYRLEVFKRRADLLFSMKAELPQYFANRDPMAPKIQELLDIGVCLPLTQTIGPAGPIVVLLRIGGADTSKFDIPEAVQLVTMIIDILVRESDNGAISGGHIIIDCKSLKMEDALRVGVDLMKVGFKMAHDACGIRPKGIYFLNPPPFLDTFYHQLTPLFLTPKVQKRVHFLQGENCLKQLNQYITGSILPKEYGGDGESVAELQELWKQKVESYRDMLLEDGANCADLSKRPEKMKDSKMFGVDGSFKKLSLE